MSALIGAVIECREPHFCFIALTIVLNPEIMIKVVVDTIPGGDGLLELHYRRSALDELFVFFKIRNKVRDLSCKA